MDRILIIGINGAGKSTLANKLGKKLNREVIHMDKLYRKPGWVTAFSKNEWLALVKDLVSQERWIIEGNYHNTLDIRLPASDTIIFLNFNKLLCLYRVFVRCYKEDPLFGIDKAEGDKNKLSWDLIKNIIKFPKKKILRMLEPYKNTKKIIIFKNSREIEKYLSTLV